MKVTVVAVGRIRPPFTEAEAHYLKLIAPKQRVEVVEVKDDAALERRLDADSHLVTLDPGGREMESLQWASWLEARRMRGRKLILVVGGPEGLPPAVLERADESISLGRQTLAHQLARIVLLEQLFRAAKIVAGEKYHL
jgi:23S rRNA (pseudouridine1915-N3)-methyltransferase